MWLALQEYKLNLYDKSEHQHQQSTNNYKERVESEVRMLSPFPYCRIFCFSSQKSCEIEATQVQRKLNAKQLNGMELSLLSFVRVVPKLRNTH